MRSEGNDSIDREHEPLREPRELLIDAAVSAWDPWLWALYLRELESERVPNVH